MGISAQYERLSATCRYAPWLEDDCVRRKQRTPKRNLRCHELQAEGTPILVRTSRSSQSAQGGRTRPFRLMARAIYEDGTLVPFILPDVSEPFVVSQLAPYFGGPLKRREICEAVHAFVY